MTKVCAECGTTDGSHYIRCSTVSPETRRAFEDIARADATDRAKAQMRVNAIKEARDSERDQVHRALDQLELHAPAWVQLIRAYVVKLEKAR